MYSCFIKTLYASHRILMILLSPLKEHCKRIVRVHRISFPPSGRERYGERLENSATLVLPLEEKFPVLKRCKENWGAKWILRKASSAVSVINGQKRGKDQPNSLLQSLKDNTITPPAPNASANHTREQFQPTFTLPRIRLARENHQSLPHITLYDQFTTLTKFDPTQFSPKIEPGATYGPVIFGPSVRAPFIPKYGHGMYTYGNSMDLPKTWNTGARKRSFTDDDEACQAIFNESKAWLASGSSGFQKRVGN